MEPFNNLQHAIEAGKSLTQVHHINGFKAMITGPHLPSGGVVLPPEKMTTPRFLTAAPVFHDVAPFIAYVRDFKDQHSRIFYTQEGSFAAVLDHHCSYNVTTPEVQQITKPMPRHGDHIAILNLQRSPEWKLWAAQSEEVMQQGDFAEFLEDNANDILNPDPASMLEVATSLHATTGAVFRRAFNQANGQVQFQFDENIDAKVAGGTKEVPTTFQIGLRPFMGCHRYPIECRLRFRVNGGNLAFHFKALQMDWMTETALDAIVKRVADETGIAPGLGQHNAAEFKRGV
jgi:uncharacterized protein YfdQ (DUF2303 family)